MTNVLHLPARADAPIACDMSTAVDTPDQRLAEYRRLFDDALVRRERGERSVALTFRASPETRATVESLARREAACCPFAEYRVQTTHDEVVFTISADREGADEMLDAFYALPDHSGSDCAGLLDRLADGGVQVVEVAEDRWELQPGDQRADGAQDQRAPEAGEDHQRTEPGDRATLARG